MIGEIGTDNGKAPVSAGTRAPPQLAPPRLAMKRAALPVFFGRVEMREPAHHPASSYRTFGSDSTKVKAAVLAPGRGRVQIVGQARWTSLSRRRIAEHRLNSSRHDQLIGNDDREIHHGHKDDEVNDRGDECTNVEICGIAAAADQLPARPSSRSGSRFLWC
jgi:hypothetical protein